MGLIERKDWDRAAESVVGLQSVTAARVALDHLRLMHDREVESLRQQHRGTVSLEAVRHGIDEIERVQYLHGTRCGDFKAALDAVRASLDLLGGQ
jgi:hypothetical protein